MIRTPFNDDWQFAPRLSMFEQLSSIGGGIDPVAVTLPHDAMLTEGRSADSPNGAHTGYFQPGAWRYEKNFDVPAQWANKRVSLEFEGVYRDAMVYINGAFAGQWAGGYSSFHISADPYLNYGESNTVRVEAQAYKDSRWYTGGGIIRPVHLLVGDLVHIAPSGLRVSTPDVDEQMATATVTTEIINEDIATRTVDLVVEVRNSDGVTVASDQAQATVLSGERITVRQRTYIHQPALWNVDTPKLYTATVRLSGVDGQSDEAETTFGIRSVTVDPVRGLRINGRATNLRGACVHHDNGLLGAATIGRADERRIELLKAAGFNAIRSAHNPMSTAMLDACDRLGMLVMDETFDMWAVSKTDDDYSRRFPQWWERDIDALVAKDFNHPSVIFYSIGNEVIEAATPHGARWGRRLAEHLRSQDPTRLVTNALNGMMAVIDDLPTLMAAAQGQSTDTAEGGFNAALGQTADPMDRLMAMPEIGARLAEPASVLDVVGLNYGDARYLIDKETFPNRIVVGSESFPTLIDRYWKLVTEHAHVIGDFTWTGWDYLGEAGIGRPTYPGEAPSFTARFPWLTAHAGDLDIIGRRRPISYYREVVFGLRHTPYLAVQRPEHHDHPFEPQRWAWTDSLASWTWDLPVGSPITAEVYADADDIEFVLNGAPVAKAEVGLTKSFVASAELTYEPGTLEAVAYRGGIETGRCSLVTAGETIHLQVDADREQIGADPQDLLFMDISFVDDNNTVDPVKDHTVTVHVEGPVTLQGLGSARPSTEEDFVGTTCTTYEGRALAILRPTGTDGIVTVTVNADGYPTATATVTATSIKSAEGERE